MIDCNIVLSFNPTPDMATTEFKRRSEDYYFEDIGKVLTMNGRYSPFIFNNDYRSSSNYIRGISNAIVLDFDDGFTIKEFMQASKFAYAIGTTKSHMIEKNGVICERYRVIIPTETAIDLDQQEYSNMMREIFEKYKGADNACKDTARAYSGYSGAKVYLKYGEYFKWEPYHEKAIKRKTLREWQRKQREKPELKNDGTKADWYRENWLNNIMRKALRVDDKFISGNRNNAIYTISRYLKEIELTNSEIVEAIEWVNNGELPDNEVNQVLKGLRIEA